MSDADQSSDMASIVSWTGQCHTLHCVIVQIPFCLLDTCRLIKISISIHEFDAVAGTAHALPMLSNASAEGTQNLHPLKSMSGLFLCWMVHVHSMTITLQRAAGAKLIITIQVDAGQRPAS
jgi:hypothetical protein